MQSHRLAAGALALLLLASGIFLNGTMAGADASPALPREVTFGSVSTQSAANQGLPNFPRDQVIPVSIEMADEDLSQLLANAIQEKEYPATVIWNEKRFPNIAFRTKGNSSLRSVAGSDSERYSFKLDLNEYIDGQFLDGIGTINLNNGFSDATYLREYLSYEAMASLGMPTPAMTWVELTLNGQLWGLYLAVEQIGKPYLQRHFGNGSGDLYKPAGQSGQGADLKWYGDSYENYSGIAYKGKAKNPDHKELLEMLDALNNGGDLEQVLDVDSVLRYTAACVVMASFDSYLGQFAHNYYLYEQGGRFSVLPWDFNMSFGGFGGAQPGNIKIDEPVQGALADRPLIGKLLEVPAYRERYHGYIEELITGYLEPERFEARARQVAALIDSYVKDDPTKFVTYEDFRRSLDEAVSSGGFGMPGGNARGGPGGLPVDPPGGQLGGDRNQEAAPAGGAGAPRDRGGFGGGGGGSMGLIPFVRAQVLNVQQQLDGTIPSTGSGATGTLGQGGPGMGGGAPGDMQLPDGAQRPQSRQRQGGMQPPDGFEGVQPPNGVQMPGRMQPPDRFRGENPARSPGSLGGIPLDQVVPTAASLILLVAGTVLVWRLRPPV